MEFDVPDSVHEYVSQHKVFSIFETALRKLVQEQPADPIDYLIQQGFSGNQVHKIILAGPPASGKGTQCSKLVEKLGVIHISTGDLLRAEVEECTTRGIEAKEYMDKGMLVPDHLLLDIVQDRLKQPDCMTSGWLLDGFPRTRNQAISLQNSNILPDIFLIIDVPDDELIERVSGRILDPQTGKIYHEKYNPPPAELASQLKKRSDDTEEILRNRLDMYHRNIGAISACYSQLIRRIDGRTSQEQVFQVIYDAIMANS